MSDVELLLPTSSDVFHPSALSPLHKKMIPQRRLASPERYQTHPTSRRRLVQLLSSLPRSYLSVLPCLNQMTLGLTQLHHRVPIHPTLRLRRSGVHFQTAETLVKLSRKSLVVPIFRTRKTKAGRLTAKEGARRLKKTPLLTEVLEMPPVGQRLRTNVHAMRRKWWERAEPAAGRLKATGRRRDTPHLSLLTA